MTTITVYATDANGVYIGPMEVDPIASLPVNCSLTPPPDGGYQQLRAGVWFTFDAYPHPHSVVTPAPTVADFEAALTNHLDATARQRRYDNRISCMARTGFPGPFQAEAIAFSSWADGCNLLAYQLLNEVQAGTRPLPATTKALIDELPPMVWPT